MKPWIPVALGVVLLGAGSWWLSHRPEPPTPSVAWVDTEDAQLKLQLNQNEVFQRAFWRRPGEQDQIVHAERRHWLDEASGGVEKWQWFIEVKPSADFAAWLFNENPFELVTVPAGTPGSEIAARPDWMPSAAALTDYVEYRKPGAEFRVFYNRKNKRLYATDQGGGFTVAQK